MQGWNSGPCPLHAAGCCDRRIQGGSCFRRERERSRLQRRGGLAIRTEFSGGQVLSAAAVCARVCLRVCVRARARVRHFAQGTVRVPSSRAASRSVRVRRLLVDRCHCGYRILPPRYRFRGQTEFNRLHHAPGGLDPPPRRACPDGAVRAIGCPAPKPLSGQIWPDWPDSA